MKILFARPRLAMFSVMGGGGGASPPSIHRMCRGAHGHFHFVNFLVGLVVKDNPSAWSGQGFAVWGCRVGNIVGSGCCSPKILLCASRLLPGRPGHLKSLAPDREHRRGGLHRGVRSCKILIQQGLVSLIVEPKGYFLMALGNGFHYNSGRATNHLL